MKAIQPNHLVFDRGHQDFSKEEFIKLVGPYIRDLKRVGRTNILCVFTYGDGSKPDVTGYRTDTTLNATINDRALKSDKTKGKWAVFRYTEEQESEETSHSS